MYLNQIYNLNHNIDQSKIFKYLVAMEDGLLMWEDISDQVQEKYGLPMNGHLGGDMMNQDLDGITNAVYSGNVTWANLPPYWRISAKHTLVVNTNVQVDDMIRRHITVKVYDYDQLWYEHIGFPTKSARSNRTSTVNSDK